MFAALLLDHRLALLFLCALVLGAAIPLAIAWARVLPEDPHPFRFDRVPKISTPESVDVRAQQNPPRDPFAIALLLCVTFSYVLQLPGVPKSLGFGSLPTVLPQDALGWLEFDLIWFFMAVPGFAAVYSLLRANFLRVPLIAAGVLVLLLWLLSSPLHAALISIS